MTDEVTQAPDPQDTPPEAEAAPQEDTQPAPIVDFEKRYNDLRPKFDQTTQQLRELTEWKQSLEAQGQEPEYDDEVEYELADEIARRDLAELKAQLAARDEREATERELRKDTSHIDSELTDLEKEYEDEFSDEEANWIGNYALGHRDEEGQPDVRAAYAQYQKILEGRKQKWVSKKKTSKRPASGPGAVEVPDLSTKEGRIAHANELMRQSEQG